ncbi:MAG: aldehyde dehydrogenase family protein, partial [Selenomonadaceae bacterium]|nr:aldehyde dehydrogenase family protein [Selenomonadaceae bacterium]
MLMKEFLTNQAMAAKGASRILAGVSTEMKNAALLKMAESIVTRQDEIISANSEDVNAAQEKGTRINMIDRLKLNPARIAAMAEGLRQTANLPDPIGAEDLNVTRPNGLKIRRVRVPFGVVGIIYEARPNVTVDAVALCIKSGNACLLRGGSEAIRTNKVLTDILIDAATSQGLPEHSIEFIAITDRDAVVAM